MTPYIIDELEVDGLLGMEETAKLGTVIRLNLRTVVVRYADEKCYQEDNTPDSIAPTSSTLDRDPEKEALVISKISLDLDEWQRLEVWKVLDKHRAVWSKPTFSTVQTKAHFEAIGRPVKDKMRLIGPEHKIELEKQIKEILSLNVIRPSKSPWASSPVFVRKADGSWRIAIDYRRVNKRIKTDGYPLLLLWEQLQQTRNHRYYAKIDGKSGFFNVPLMEASKELTAFNSHIGLFEYNMIPFGVKNSPAEFQRVMDNILSELYNKGVLCYIDDIVIYSNCFYEWLRLLDKVFFRLGKGGVYVEPKKCDFGPKEIHLLGHILSADGIKPNPAKVVAVKNVISPRNKKELMLFLGLVGFLRRFIPTYSDKTIHLSNLLKKDANFNWTPECESEFNRLYNLVTDSVLLLVPSGHGPFIVIYDASVAAIGSVLCQWRNKEIHVLEFALKKFSTAEKNWSTREKEAYAIRWSVQKYQDYLKGSQTYVFTNHQNLQWMDTASSGKVQWWVLFHQQFDLKVCAISGRDNGMVDWLSRSAIEPDDVADEEIDMISNPMYLLSTTNNTHPISIDVSPYLPTLPQWKTSSADIPKGDKPYVKLAADCLWYSVRGSKLYVPTHLRESIMYWFHAGRYGGHLGVNRTTRRITQWFYWPRLKRDVATYIDACLPCKRVGSPGIHYLRQVLERAEPFQLISLDHVGPRDWAGRKVYYLVIIDHFSRFLIAQVVSHPNATETINIMKNIWITHFGAPEVLLVDR